MKGQTISHLQFYSSTVIGEDKLHLNLSMQVTMPPQLIEIFTFIGFHFFQLEGTCLISKHQLNCGGLGLQHSYIKNKIRLQIQQVYLFNKIKEIISSKTLLIHILLFNLNTLHIAHTRLYSSKMNIKSYPNIVLWHKKIC